MLIVRKKTGGQGESDDKVNFRLGLMESLLLTGYGVKVINSNFAEGYFEKDVLTRGTTWKGIGSGGSRAQVFQEPGLLMDATTKYAIRTTIRPDGRIQTRESLLKCKKEEAAPFRQSLEIKMSFQSADEIYSHDSFSHFKQF